MTKEQNKDIRLMLDMIAKDLSRLSDDVKYLAVYLEPLAEEDNESRECGETQKFISSDSCRSRKNG